MALKKGPAASDKSVKESLPSTHPMSTRNRGKQQKVEPSTSSTNSTAASKPTHNTPVAKGGLRNLVDKVFTRTGLQVAGGLATVASAAGAVYFGYVDPASLLSSATTMGNGLLATAAGYGVTSTNVALALIPATLVKTYDNYVSRKTDAKLDRDLSNYKSDNIKLDADVKKLQADLKKAQDEKVVAEEAQQEKLKDLNEQVQKLEAANADLTKKQKTTAKKQKDLDKREEALDEREEGLDEREKAFNNREAELAALGQVVSESSHDNESSSSEEFGVAKTAANDPTLAARTFTPGRQVHAQRTQVPVSEVRQVADSIVGADNQGQKQPSTPPSPLRFK